MKPDNIHSAVALIYGENQLTHAIRNRLIIENMAIVEPIAARFRGRKGIPFDDLIAAGREGLVKAAKSWQRLGMFAAYAEKRIWGEIFNFVDSWQHLIPVGSADEVTLHFHEWDIWGSAAPYEKWTNLVATPEELVCAFDELNRQRDALIDAWKFLPKMERSVIELRYFRDPPHTLNSIAREFKMPYATLVDFINRTLKRLADEVSGRQVA